jgi:hypothetical protein
MSGDGCVPHGEDYPCARCFPDDPMNRAGAAPGPEPSDNGPSNAEIRQHFERLPMATHAVERQMVGVLLDRLAADHVAPAAAGEPFEEAIRILLAGYESAIFHKGAYLAGILQRLGLNAYHCTETRHRFWVEPTEEAYRCPWDGNERCLSEGELAPEPCDD